MRMTEDDGLMRGFGRLGVLVRVMVLLVAAWFTGGLAIAQPLSQADPATADRLAALEKTSAAQAATIAAAQTAGDNAWMLTSSALVLLMSGPGLALFYGGLVRRKNVLGTMMQTFAMMAATPKLGRAEAFRRAMLSLIEEGKPPSYWAPFVVVGD